MTAQWRVPEDDPYPGQVIDGRYHLVEYIDGGSFGDVWRAWDPKLAREVAIKLLLPHHDPDVAREDRKRFEREARMTAAFEGEHHIINVFDYGEDQGQRYLVMKLMRGENLQHLLSGKGRLDPPRAVRILGQVAEALGEAHRQGLVHRDVKPGNVFIEAGDKATLLDFGMLGALDRRRLSDLSRRNDLGGGTLEYMAPERYFGDDGSPPEAPSSPPGDIYSLGCLLYQCLTGRRPFRGQTEGELQRQHRYGPRPLPGEWVWDRSEFDAVVAQSLAVDPNDRPPSPMDFFQDVKDALAAWERGRASDVQPPPPVLLPPPPTTDDRPTVDGGSPDDDTGSSRTGHEQPDPPAVSEQTDRPEPEVEVDGAPPPDSAPPPETAPPPDVPAHPSGPGSSGPVLVGGASTGIVGALAVLLAGISPIASGLTIAASWAAGACLGWWYGSRAKT